MFCRNGKTYVTGKAVVNVKRTRYCKSYELMVVTNGWREEKIFREMVTSFATRIEKHRFYLACFYFDMRDGTLTLTKEQLDEELRKNPSIVILNHKINIRW